MGRDYPMRIPETRAVIQRRSSGLFWGSEGGTLFATWQGTDSECLQLQGFPTMPAPATAPQNPHRYALIIGVNHYPDFPGEDLQGCVFDANAWYSLALQLGTPAENIVVLTASDDPLPTALLRAYEAPKSIKLGGANKASIVRELKAIINTVRGDSEAEGLIFYAGHGAHDATSLLLCPSDVQQAGEGYDNAISFAEILEYIGPGEQKGLTFVLDACYAGGAATSTGGAPTPSSRSLTRNPPAASFSKTYAAQHGALSSQVVILAASEADQEAYEYCLQTNLDHDRVVHGVLTTAVSELMRRWYPPQDAATMSVEYPISYATLVERSVRLASALAFEQTPNLSGPDGCQDWLAFRNTHGDTLTDAPTIPGRELSGDTTEVVIGDIHDSNGIFRGFYLSYDSSATAFWVDNIVTGETYTVVAPTFKIYQQTSYNNTTLAASWSSGGAVTKNLLFLMVQQPSAGSVNVGFIMKYGGHYVWIMTLELPAIQGGFSIAPGSMGSLMTTGESYPVVVNDEGQSFSQTKENIEQLPSGASRFYVSLVNNTSTNVGIMDYMSDGEMVWYRYYYRRSYLIKEVTIGGQNYTQKLVLQTQGSPLETTAYEAVDGS